MILGRQGYSILCSVQLPLFADNCRLANSASAGQRYHGIVPFGCLDASVPIHGHWEAGLGKGYNKSIIDFVAVHHKCAETGHHHV